MNQFQNEQWVAGEERLLEQLSQLQFELERSC